MRLVLSVTAAAGVVALAAGMGLRVDPLEGSTDTVAANRRTHATALPQPAGKALFDGKGNCATCHGRDAKGTPLGPDLTDDEWLNISGTLPEITALVRTGVLRPTKYPTPMPPMGGARLRDAEIDAIARYVHQLRAPD